MRSNCRISLLFLLAAMLPLPVAAQRFEWGADERIVIDNREGDDTYTATKTFLQSQLAAEVGVSFLDGQHRLMAGGVWTQPFVDNFKEGRLSPTIYYRYSTPTLSGSLGLSPRSQLLRKPASFVWSDSITYADANIRGALIQYKGKSGFGEMWLDWRGLQSRERREAFSVVAQGEWWFSGPWLIGGTALLNHFAVSSHHDASQGVCENYILNPVVGVELGGKVPLDSLAVRVGCLASFSRDRSVQVRSNAVGVWLDVAAQWRWLSLKNTLYAGGRPFPFYGRYGSHYNEGEPYYAAKFYNSTTVSADIVRNRVVNLRASLDFNAASHAFTWYQRLTLRVAFDSGKWRDRGNLRSKPYLPNLY